MKPMYRYGRREANEKRAHCNYTLLVALIVLFRKSLTGSHRFIGYLSLGVRLSHFTIFILYNEQPTCNVVPLIIGYCPPTSTRPSSIKRVEWVFTVSFLLTYQYTIQLRTVMSNGLSCKKCKEQLLCLPSMYA
eukprot:3011925-Pleurochrysis_carterae.AAC.1